MNSYESLIEDYLFNEENNYFCVASDDRFCNQCGFCQENNANEFEMVIV